MKFPNECRTCGRPTHGNDYCDKCSSTMFYCVTAGAKDFPDLVRAKIKHGFITHDKPLAIGGGYFVQMMV